jgi:putative transposase
MLAVAIESGVEGFIDKNRSLKTANDKAAIVRNGYLPERTIQTGLGDIAVKVPKEKWPP